MRPIHTVYLIFLISRETLAIEAVLLSNSANPCVDASRFFPSTFCSWNASSHDEAYRRAAEWLRSPGCHLPEAVVKMALPDPIPLVQDEQPIEGETLGEFRKRLGKPGTNTHAADFFVWREGSWRRKIEG